MERPARVSALVTGHGESGSQLTLALDCSTPFLAIAVVDDSGHVLGRFSEEVGRDHAARAVNEVAALLEAQPAGRERVGRVVAGTGPGSYTGVRVALATASGLARALGAQLFGASSFVALAAGLLGPGDEAVVTLDARRGNVYAATCVREPREADLAPIVRLTAGPEKVASAAARELGPGLPLIEAGRPDAAALAVSPQTGPAVAVYL